MSGNILIVGYDPEWPQLFRRAAYKLSQFLGLGRWGIEHTGSTSVPGLAAKPIVDIFLVVKDSADEDSDVPDLEGAGYALRIREPNWH